MAGAKSSGIVIKVVLFLFLICYCSKINAAKYIVGDEFGWDDTIDMETWPEGKKFYAGDVFVFNYDYQLSNVVVTDEEGFLSCTVTKNSTVYEDGHDKIRLPFGQSYFISGYPEQCQIGLKMAIYAHKWHRF